MKLPLIAAATLGLLSVPLPANAQLFGNLDNSTVLGGAAGGSLGAIAGSRIAGSGNRTEGAIIGGVAGGLLGSAYGNSQSTNPSNPYAGRFNPGFNQRNLVGTGIGAGVGGVVGSRIAGSGNRTQGALIGAAVGGAAGYGIANHTAPRAYHYGSGVHAPVRGYGYSAGAQSGPTSAHGQPAYIQTYESKPAYASPYRAPNSLTVTHSHPHTHPAPRAAIAAPYPPKPAKRVKQPLPERPGLYCFHGRPGIYTAQGKRVG